MRIFMKGDQGSVIAAKHANHKHKSIQTEQIHDRIHRLAKLHIAAHIWTFCSIVDLGAAMAIYCSV